MPQGKKKEFFYGQENQYGLLAVDYLTEFQEVIRIFQDERYIDSAEIQKGVLYRLKRGLGRLTRRGQSDLAMKVVDTPVMLGNDIQTEFELGSIDMIWHRYGLDFNRLDENVNMPAALSLYPSIRNVFALDGIEKKNYSVEEFVMCYIDVSSARKGSTLTKISSTLNTCGKDISFVFPKTRSRHKYFALSPSMLDFFVRLYLAREESSYAYLDNFLAFLQERYGICI